VTAQLIILPLFGSQIALLALAHVRSGRRRSSEGALQPAPVGAFAFPLLDEPAVFADTWPSEDSVSLAEPAVFADTWLSDY
jgi:hypothetical protein